MLSRLFTGLMNKRLQRRGYIGYMLLLFFIVLSALMTTLGTGTLAHDFIASNIAKMAIPLIAGMVALFLLVGYANINLDTQRGSAWQGSLQWLAWFTCTLPCCHAEWPI